MSFLFFGTALAQFLQYDRLFVSLTNLWVVVSMDCCRLTGADRGVLNIPIKSCASATRKSSCLYFFFWKLTDSFIMRKASMMAVLIRKNNTYFHHFLLGRPTKYFEQNWSKMSTPRKKKTGTDWHSANLHKQSPYTVNGFLCGYFSFECTF